MKTAKQMYEMYVDAEYRIGTCGQVVEIEGRRLTYANLSEVAKMRAQWHRQMINENNRGRGHSLASFYE